MTGMTKESKKKKYVIIIAIAVVILIIAVMFIFKDNTGSKGTITANSPNFAVAGDIEIYGVEYPSSICEGSYGYIKGKISIKTKYDQNLVVFEVKDSDSNIVYKKERYFTSGDNNFDVSFTPKDYNSGEYTFVVHYKNNEVYAMRFRLVKESPQLEVKTSYEKKYVESQPRGRLIYYTIGLSILSKNTCSISGITITPKVVLEETGTEARVVTIGGSPYGKLTIKKLDGMQEWKKNICVIEKESPINYNHYDYELTYGVSSDFASNEMCFVKLSEPSNLLFQFSIQGKGIEDITNSLRVEVPEIGFPQE